MTINNSFSELRLQFYQDVLENSGGGMKSTKNNTLYERRVDRFFEAEK